MAHLDAALALAPDGDQWRAHADADHESISSMFGGWTATMATELVGVQWQINSPSPPRACNVDIRIDDIKFLP